MRFTRIITALIAVFTAAMVGLTTSSAAEAADVQAKAAAKPYHTIAYLQAGETSTDGIFYVKGRLTSAPGYAVYLQARTKARPTWRTVKYVRSAADTGRFVIKWGGKCGAGYQIVVRETYSFARTARYLGRVSCS